jgi:hypothetical protein
MPEPASQSPSPAKPSTITFFFEKTGSFQTSHADGVFGSVTPSGQVFLAFYVERSPIPKTMVCPISADGTIGEPSEFTGKQGIFREVQSAVVLSPNALNDLKTHIEKLQNILKDLKDAAKTS